MIRFETIATGSSGNSYLLRSGSGRSVLLDAGVQYPRICRAVEYKPSQIDAALITHEHMDHAKSVRDVISAGIPTWMTIGTNLKLEAVGWDVGGSSIIGRGASGYRQIRAGEWKINPFPIVHDAEEPVGFYIQRDDLRIVYATDTHYIPHRLASPTHLIIECNFVTDLLLQNIGAGKVTTALRKRLMESHLSLEELIRYLGTQDLSRCCKIVLIHLSAGNSDEARMTREVENATGISTVAADKGMRLEFSATPF